MTKAELEAIIQGAGGECWALGYTEALLDKINRLEAAGGYASLLAQLRSAKESGDFRGRVLEVNFADIFIEKGIGLQYGVKQGMSGDVDFCWCVNANQVFIEMKLLGQDKNTKTSVNKQLRTTGCSTALISDDTKDVARIQRDIFQKSTKKFNPKPESTWVNLIAVDVSELQLSMIDIGDCLLAVGGNESVKNYHSAIHRPGVVGIFECPCKMLTEAQAEWIKCYHNVENVDIHPRDYIHGVLFLFRNPKERAALSYKLNGSIVWNSSLIDETRAKLIREVFHQIVPPK